MCIVEQGDWADFKGNIIFKVFSILIFWHRNALYRKISHIHEQIPLAKDQFSLMMKTMEFWWRTSLGSYQSSYFKLKWNYIFSRHAVLVGISVKYQFYLSVKLNLPILHCKALSRGGYIILCKYGQYAQVDDLIDYQLTRKTSRGLNIMQWHV